MDPGSIIALVSLVMKFLPEIIKLIQDLKDGHYDGDGGVKLVEKSKELVQKVEDAHKKAA